jgi:cysteinyl-tRNA synthetase
MSAEILGQPLDIHGGGKDLIFPHHENEIAQSEAAGDKEFVRYWMHNGFVNIDSEKMSKSLGNFFTIREVLEKYRPEVIRFFLLSTHYRSPLDFSDRALTEAQTRYERFMNLFARIHRTGAEDRDLDEAENKCTALLSEEIEPHFRESMDDDFNTAAAIGHLFTALGTILDRADSEGRGVAAAWKEAVDSFFQKIGHVLGFFEGGMADSEAWFAAGSDDDSKAKAQLMAEERVEARTNKDWGKADELRDAIAELGFEVQDTPQGPVLVPKKD